MEKNSETSEKNHHSQGKENKQDSETPNKNALKETSMSTLITWNISKAIEKNPNIDLKVAFRAAQTRLDRAPHDVNEIITQFPEQRHIACALLAWKELGHKHADSLYDFFLNRQKEQQQQVPSCSKPKQAEPQGSCWYSKIGHSQMANACAQAKNSCKVGPVVKIPTVMNSQMEAKLSREKRIPMDTRLMNTRYSKEYRVPPVIETTVMRLENDSCAQQPPTKRKGLDKDLLRKIDEVCCLESGCADRLAALDASTKDLRARAAKLARREAERSELLERAESAWKDLERGYQRRLTLAIEKEEDITRQMQKLITERNGYKNVCSSLVNQLRDRGDAAEKVRSKLAEVEKEVCARACTRLQLSEEAAKEDAALAHQQCLSTQLDRDLQFKEEQARRKVATMESELESSLALMNESERAMRAELNGLREQMTLVSNDLLDEDKRNAAIKEEIGKLEKLKTDMSGDLSGCKDMCDKKMQKKVDELAKKREQLEQLKEKSVECRCKEPKEVSVTVKRTPSLAALCRCRPEDKFLESCSCTSLRSSLLSNLLSDLFRGLQSELGETGLAMPCQMLKCLEDNHNWDRASNVKTKLHNFFSKLLVKELEIAVSTSIENYHARWVGASCADTVRQSIPDFGDVDSEGWQQRALERRAQQLAEQLAEKMFKEKTEEILQQAKEVVEKGPPPCDCDKPGPPMQRGSSSTHPPSKNPSCCCSNSKGTALYSCLLDRPVMAGKSTVLQMTNSKLPDLTQTKPLPNRQSSLCKKVGTSFNKGLNSANKLTVAATVCRSKSPGSSKCSNANRATGTLALDLLTKNQVLDNCSPECLRQAMDDVLQLRAQIDELKKESLKKTDLMMMEKHIVKMIQQTTDNCNLDSTASAHCAVPPPSESSLKEGNGGPPERGPRSTTVRILPTTAHNCLGRVPLATSKSTKHRSKTPEKLKPKPYKRPGQLFAVNLCLCGETKAQKKIRQAKLNARKDNPELEKLSMTKAEENPVESPSNLSQESCKSDCVCLNKNPSCTSIDKLLETLAKWKCDLMSSDDLCKAEISQKNKTLASSHDLTENHKLDKQNLHSVSHPNGISNKVSKKSYLSDRNSTKNRYEQEIEHPIPVTTESEYMGAVNLEKSNETFCRCVIAKEMETNKTRGVNNMINSDFTINDLNSCDCCFKRSEKKNEDPSSVLNKTRIKHNSSYLVKKHSQKNKVYSGDARNSDINSERKVYGAKFLSNTVHGEKIIDRNEENNQISGQGEIVSRKDVRVKSSKNASHIGNIVKNTLYPCDCDYQIKFIGVTLANETSEINKKGLDDQIACSAPFSPPPLPKLIGTNIQNDYWTSVVTQSKIITDKKETEFNSSNKHISCQCNVNFDELKNFFDNTFNKQIGDLAINDDKEVDTNSLKDIQLGSAEPCVCHNYVKKEESNELEVNTFNLIEEHLKEKFLKFKQHCDSCCLAHDEENKFYTTVMKKIRQIILDSTKTVICQCNDDQEGQGSWNRAYDLLQEYIRAKIKRVQCICAYPESESRNIVPDVTEKVCSLIKNDFERLKDICDCKKTKGIPQKTSSDKRKIHQKYHIEKDGIVTKNSLYETFTREATLNIDSTLLTKTLSSQVSINKMEYENKSCDAIKKPHELSQTENNVPTMINTSTENNCTNYVIPKVSKLVGDIKQEKEDFSKKSEEASKNMHYCNDKSVPNKKSAPLPFIGYTIDCSCGNNLLNCICSKSTVKNNDIKIDNMWKSYTNRKIDEKKVAYIMDNVDVEPLHQSDFCGKNRLNLHQTTENIAFCDNETCTKCEEDIILKYSDQHWDYQDHTTNTYFQDTCRIRRDLNIEDPYEWLERGSPSELKEQDFNPHVEQATKSESINTDSSRKSKNNDTDCNCDMVPVCHVKMLIQNIENKLTNSECVCDSMDPQVCPIHSRRNVI